MEYLTKVVGDSGAKFLFFFVLEEIIREDTGGHGRSCSLFFGVFHFLVEEMKKKNFDSSLSPAAWTKRNIHALILKKTNYDVVFIRSGTN